MNINIRIHAGSSKEEIRKISSRAEVKKTSSKEEIRKISGDSYEVWLRERAIDNKANLALIKILKKHFRKPIKIKMGMTSRNKIIEVGND